MNLEDILLIIAITTTILLILAGIGGAVQASEIDQLKKRNKEYEDLLKNKNESFDKDLKAATKTKDDMVERTVTAATRIRDELTVLLDDLEDYRKAWPSTLYLELGKLQGVTKCQ
jgi:hypothetical protein